MLLYDRETALLLQAIKRYLIIKNFPCYKHAQIKEILYFNCPSKNTISEMVSILLSKINNKAQWTH